MFSCGAAHMNSAEESIDLKPLKKQFVVKDCLMMKLKDCKTVLLYNLSNQL